MPFDQATLRRRRRHRHADAGLDARHLLRLHLGGLPAGRGAAICSRRSAMAVVFAMLASYGISRTLTPIMIGLLLRKEHERHGEAHDSGLFARFHAASTRASSASAASMSGCSAAPAAHRSSCPLVARLRLAPAPACSRYVGRDFFPRSTPG